MKCPKCGYVSFDFLDECKKCKRDLGAHKKKFNIYVQMATPLNIEEYQKIISESEKTQQVKDMPPQMPIATEGISAQIEEEDGEISTAILDADETGVQELDVLDLNITEPLSTDMAPKDAKADDTIDLTINLDEQTKGEVGNIELSGMLNLEESEDLKLDGIELNIEDNPGGTDNNIVDTIELQSSLDIDLLNDNSPVADKKTDPKLIKEETKKTEAKKDEPLEGIDIDFGNIDLS